MPGRAGSTAARARAPIVTLDRLLLFGLGRQKGVLRARLAQHPAGLIDDHDVRWSEIGNGGGGLVAFAVPDLAGASVVIVDEAGRVLSQSSAQGRFSPEAEQQQAGPALLSGAGARRRRAHSSRHPGGCPRDRPGQGGGQRAGGIQPRRRRRRRWPPCRERRQLRRRPRPPLPARPRRSAICACASSSRPPCHSTPSRPGWRATSWRRRWVPLDEAAGDELPSRSGWARRAMPPRRREPGRSPIASVPPTRNRDGPASFGGVWLYLIISVALFSAGRRGPGGPAGRAGLSAERTRSGDDGDIRSALRDPEPANAG